MINETIFRAYDIRGTYEVNLFNETAYMIGKAFGSYIKGNKVLVGYDNRLSSPILCENLIKGLVETGAEVINLGLVTTPMYYRARYKLDIWSAIMITASHNPANDNGFKISFDDRGNACGEEIIEFKNFVVAGKFKQGIGKVTNYEIREDYVNLMVNSLKLGNKKIKAAIDCGNGTCSVVIKDILNKLDIDTELLYCESDGTFPNHHPDPAVSENLVELQKLVVEKNCDLGMAFDADGDRVRFVDNEGNIINTDVFMIIVYRYLSKQLKIRKGLMDVKCSKSLIDDLNKLDIEPIMYRTGNSYMFRKMKELNLDFGGEYSGHIWFGDRFETFDDGIYAGLRMIEILSTTDKTLIDLYNDISKYFSTDELKIKTTEENKALVVEKVKEYADKKNYKYNDIDGIRVMFDDGWALIRFSNTSPNITVRFEANTETRLEEINNEFMKVIEASL